MAKPLALSAYADQRHVPCFGPLVPPPLSFRPRCELLTEYNSSHFPPQHELFSLFLRLLMRKLFYSFLVAHIQSLHCLPSATANRSLYTYLVLRPRYLKMDYIPDRLVRGLKQARGATSTAGNTATATMKNGKITHAVGKLAQAGVVDDSEGALVNTGTTTSTIHSEKITHMATKLAQAGLSTDDDGTKSSSHGLATKYIIIIAVGSALVLLAALIGGCLCWRRYRRRRAYNVVSRGVDANDKRLKREKEDVFNADMGETENFNTEGSKLTERNFESGYDKVDTGYEGTGYGATEEQGPSHGDRRSNFEA